MEWMNAERPVDALLHPVEPSRAGWVVRQLVGERVMRERALDEKHRLHWRGARRVVPQTLEREGDDARPEAVTDQVDPQVGVSALWSSQEQRPEAEEADVARSAFSSPSTSSGAPPPAWRSPTSRPKLRPAAPPMSMVPPMSIDPPSSSPAAPWSPRPRPRRTPLANVLLKRLFQQGGLLVVLPRPAPLWGIARQLLHQLLKAGPRSSSLFAARSVEERPELVEHLLLCREHLGQRRPPPRRPGCRPPPRWRHLPRRSAPPGRFLSTQRIAGQITPPVAHHSRA